MKVKNYIESWSLNLESDVEYELWDELFKSRKPAKLGEQVRAEIEQWSSDVEDEFMTSPIEFFDEMNVEQGLNDKEATSAIKFIDHPQIRYVVGGDGIRLINVLESATRNRVIKLANSRVDKSKDGLLCILKALYGIVPKKNEPGQSFVLDTLQDTPPRMTLAFFNFLYAETLLDISERADGEGPEFRTPFLEDNARSSRSLIEVYDEIKAFSQQTPTSDELLKPGARSNFCHQEIILMKTRIMNFVWDPPIGFASIAMSLQLMNPPDGTATTHSLEKLREEMMNPDLWSKFSGQSELEGDLANAR